MISSSACFEAVLDGAMAMPFDPVGSAGWRDRLLRPGQRSGAVPVEGLELLQVDSLDVAADAALAEGQRHPRFESLDHAGLHLRVLVEVVVQAAGVGIHQGLQPLRALLILRLHVVRVDEELHAQVPVHLALALGLRQAPHGVQVVRLDAVEIVLGLRVHHAEDGVGIGLSVDVGNAPVVPDDGDVLGLSLPGGDVLLRGRVGSGTYRRSPARSTRCWLRRRGGDQAYSCVDSATENSSWHSTLIEMT